MASSIFALFLLVVGGPLAVRAEAPAATQVPVESNSLAPSTPTDDATRLAALSESLNLYKKDLTHNVGDFAAAAAKVTDIGLSNEKLNYRASRILINSLHDLQSDALVYYVRGQISLLKGEEISKEEASIEVLELICRHDKHAKKWSLF